MKKTRLAGLLKESSDEQAAMALFDMEGIGSMDQFVEAITGVVDESLKWLKNYHETADIVTPMSIEGSFEDIEKVGFATIADINIFRAINVTAGMSDYSTLLNRQTAQFVDLQTRLYAPIEEWTTHAEAMDSFHNTPMTSGDLEFSDIDGLKKDMKKMYDLNGSKDEKSEIVKFKTQFRSIKELKICGHNFEKAHINLQAINLDTIKRSEEKILLSVSGLLDQIDQGEKEEFSKAAKVQVVKALRSLAEETEYMASLVLMTNVAINAWNETIEKLKAIVEE